MSQDRVPFLLSRLINETFFVCEPDTLSNFRFSRICCLTTAFAILPRLPLLYNAFSSSVKLRMNFLYSLSRSPYFDVGRAAVCKRHTLITCKQPLEPKWLRWACVGCLWRLHGCDRGWAGAGGRGSVVGAWLGGGCMVGGWRVGVGRR